MDQHQRDEWEGIVRSAFGPEKHFDVDPGASDFVALVSWSLPDTNRPNKRSKTIRLVISREAVYEYFGKEDESRREQDRQKVVTWIRNKIESFDPDHDAPHGQISPEVKWTIRSDVLNS